MDRDLPIWKIENKYQICYKVPPLSLWQAQSSLKFHLFVLIVILLYLGVFCPELNLYFWCISQALTSTIPSSLDCKPFRIFLIPFSSQWPHGLLKLDFRVEKEHGNASLSLFLVKKTLPTMLVSAVCQVSILFPWSSWKYQVFTGPGIFPITSPFQKGKWRQ